MANTNEDPCDQTPGPELDTAILDPYCPTSKRMLLLTGLLRRILTVHFSDAENIEAEELRDKLWTPGDTNTGILIESITRWFPSNTEKTPAIVIKRNRYQQVRLGINNQWLNACRDGRRLFTVAWQGTHTLFCISGEPGEVELLQAETQRELTEFGPLIRRYLNLLRFDIVDVGPIYLLEEAKQNFMVPVSVGMAYDESWTVGPVE